MQNHHSVHLRVLCALSGSRMKIVHLIATIGILLALTACGKKGPVRPLEASLPDAVTAVELRQRGDEILLGWQLPTRNQNGTPLETAPVIDIYRGLFDPADNCPECKDLSTLLHAIDPELPNPARKSGVRYLLLDRQVAADQGYQYTLVPRNQRGQSGRPLTMRIVFTQPPAAPIDFVVEPHDRSATLQWRSVLPETDQQLIGYNVYRREGKTAEILLNQRPLTKPTYEDFGLENGKPYSYSIRALLKQDGHPLESLPTAAVSAIPQTGL